MVESSFHANADVRRNGEPVQVSKVAGTRFSGVKHSGLLATDGANRS